MPATYQRIRSECLSVCQIFADLGCLAKLFRSCAACNGRFFSSSNPSCSETKVHKCGTESWVFSGLLEQSDLDDETRARSSQNEVAMSFARDVCVDHQQAKALSQQCLKCKKIHNNFRETHTHTPHKYIHKYRDVQSMLSLRE